MLRNVVYVIYMLNSWMDVHICTSKYFYFVVGCIGPVAVVACELIYLIYFSIIGNQALTMSPYGDSSMGWQQIEQSTDLQNRRCKLHNEKNR